MAETVAVRARYDSFDAFEQGLRALKGSEFGRYEAYGPIDLAELEELMPDRGSPVRIWATTGALIGLASFFFMCTASSLIYGLVTGGKPPISTLPFIIVSYEGTILCGAIAAFAAVLALARLWPRKPSPDYDPRFSSDSFGVVVRCAPDQRLAVIGLLKESGAIEVNELE